MPTEVGRLFGWMTLFFVAMAFLESAVVVYLRAIYYPEGFDFPLVPMSSVIIGTEVIREFATLIMLLVPGALVSRFALDRFAWFCFGFGVWDIFYYIWLKVLLGWPSSLASRDLLFLIPVPWVGPVWAPCLVSLGLIVLAVVLLYGRSERPIGLVDGWAWLLLCAGGLLIIVSFTLDSLLNVGSGLDLMDAAGSSEWQMALENGRDYVPITFPWPWFVAGCLVALSGIYRVFRRASSVH